MCWLRVFMTVASASSEPEFLIMTETSALLALELVLDVTAGAFPERVGGLLCVTEDRWK